MITESVSIQCKNIKDWDSFHSEFARVFGFPEFYGRNMSAWHDCMSDLHDPDSGMSKIHCKKDKPITMVLEDARGLKKRCPEQYQAILEATAFVNWRNMEVGEPPVTVLSFST